MKGYRLSDDTDSAGYPTVLTDNIFGKSAGSGNSKRSRAQTQ